MEKQKNTKKTKQIKKQQIKTNQTIPKIIENLKK